MSCSCAVFVLIQNAVMHNRLPTTAEYSIVPVPTKVWCTATGQTVRDCLFTSSSWLTAICLVFQEQRERLASQSSVLSNGEENMYATLNESAKAVSLTFFEY